ncbi:hypothetical protein [Rufibacter quisquiliarum]|uniref:Uncharacterized protein n=1 Tax=Rufibacter quisquiliarum TaxID=1549639 RepID=A0A839GV69_9BACT|nr:hypothetical protein [Rufibacter quisquiliarum]MBA9078328.1 hypothetical protein [Rufibacter quisquiliarum]
MAIYKPKPSPVLTGASASRFMKMAVESEKRSKTAEAIKERKELDEFYELLKSKSNR